jgi:hypothetical protein
MARPALSRSVPTDLEYRVSSFLISSVRHLLQIRYHVQVHSYGHLFVHKTSMPPQAAHSRLDELRLRSFQKKSLQGTQGRSGRLRAYRRKHDCFSKYAPRWLPSQTRKYPVVLTADCQNGVRGELIASDMKVHVSRIDGDFLRSEIRLIFLRGPRLPVSTRLLRAQDYSYCRGRQWSACPLDSSACPE